MPWVEGEDKQYYKEPLLFAHDAESVDYLIIKKKTHAQDRELFLKYQKDFGRDDREFGKFMRDQAAEEMKFYRGCCFALSKIAAFPPGDSINLEASKELSPYIDMVFAAVDLEWCQRNLEGEKDDKGK